MAEEQVDYAPSVREGSRWYDNPPTAAELAEWFASVPVHQELEERKANYVGAVTLIPAGEDVKRTAADGSLVEITRRVWIPYAKVEGRAAYFYDYCEAKGWRGAFEPADVARIAVQDGTAGLANEHLPPGFFRMPVGQSKQTEQQAHFICCSMRVTAYAPSRALGEGGERLVLTALGTKQVPALDKQGKADPNALMKAETGAIGRALGLAGMLVIPGSGVATAEDVLESMGQAGAAGGGNIPTPELPPAEAPQSALPVTDPESLNDRVVRLLSELDDYPEQKQKLQAWAQEKKLALTTGELADSQLRTIDRKIGQLLAEARA